MLNFEEFMKTAKHTDRLWDEVGVCQGEVQDSGFVFQDGGYVEIIGAGVYMCIVGNLMIDTTDLEEAAKFLYDNHYVYENCSE